MTSTTFAVSFTSQLATADEALELANLIAATLQNGFEERNGVTVGGAQNNLVRFFIHRNINALERDRDLTAATLRVLGPERGFRVASFITRHIDDLRTVGYWAALAEELRAECPQNA